MTKIDVNIVSDIKELYEMGDDIDSISRHLGIDRATISYYIGMSKNSPPKRYIKDQTKRNEEIAKLESKDGKCYKEILYLNYLRGKISKIMYESGF